jgi:hypothetical protein
MRPIFTESHVERLHAVQLSRALRRQQAAETRRALESQHPPGRQRLRHLTLRPQRTQ